jgi:hypothetical protein
MESLDFLLKPTPGGWRMAVAKTTISVMTSDEHRKIDYPSIIETFHGKKLFKFRCILQRKK